MKKAATGTYLDSDGDGAPVITAASLYVDYLYESTGQVRWNTGATDASTVWILEPK